MSGTAVRALALHAGYRCRHSGACCTAGWPIAVEPGIETRVRAAHAAGRLQVTAAPAGSALLRAGDGPAGARTSLPCDTAGRCLFLEASGLCAIHRQLGEEALPSACRHFPRVARLTPRGVDVTLSHFCPTAAGLLFAAAAPAAPDPLLRVVEWPAAFPGERPYEGLDARQALPPFVRPGVLASWEALLAWETHAVAVLAEPVPPESALASLADTAERVRGWTPGDGDFDRHLERELARGKRAAGTPQGARTHAAPPSAGEALEAWHAVAAAVPSAHRASLPAAQRFGKEAEARVDAGWAALAAPVRRWLAAKAFASWLALQGEGLRTSVLGLRAALGVLRAEALRGCSEAACELDAEVLRAAFRRADLLLLHLADPAALARRLGRAERAGASVLGSRPSPR